MGFFKKIFGPSQKEVWMEVAKNMGGGFIEGGFTKPHMIVVRHHNWEIVLDTEHRDNDTYTRMRVAFVNTSGIDFKVYQKSFFSTIGKSLGMQDIAIGNEAFDNDFIVKGNNEKLIIKLLSDAHLRGAISSQLEYSSLEIKDDEGWFGKSFPKGIDQIYFEQYGLVKEPTALKNMVRLSTLLLDRLVEIEAISSKSAGINLKE
ncbi:MAG: DUF3137 domain-containing protein [Cytophagales bacterium]|nr:DUF3137 domain-containing protein [Cytophagales bacterium]